MSVAFRNWSLLRQWAGAGRTTPSSADAGRPSRAAFCLVRFLVCYLLPAWCCIVAAAATASAATSPVTTSGPQEPAPMCDPDGASVAAPEDIPEVDRGRFEALPCEAQLLLTGWRPDMPEVGRKAVSCNDAEPAPVHHAPPPPHRFEGARAFTVSFPVRPEPLNTEFGEVNVLAYRRGHERGLFRPPVAR
jgi:hypothetical protein